MISWFALVCVVNFAELTGAEPVKLQEQQQQLAGTIADLQVCGTTCTPVLHAF
jgi:hypothetical protein